MRKSLLFLLLPVVASACHVETVDSAPAVAVAQAFYKSLSDDDPKAALSYFSHDFKAETQWPRLLGGLNDRYGPVMSADLQASSLVGDGHSPCYLLTYAVKRHALVEDDLLFVCRDSGSSHWSIHGHRLTRRDTNQSIAGGVLPAEVGIKAP